jgi:uncharacterized protein YciI
MLYFVYLEDIAENADIRSRLLDAHMEHIGNYVEHIQLGGPIMRSGSESQAGGILIVEAESEASVKDMIQADPYFKAGLWQEIKVHPFREILNRWVQIQ